MSREYPVVCLVGSSRFKADHLEAMKQETLQGKIVLGMGLFGHEEGLDMEGPVKAMLDRLHLAKIDLANEVLIVAPDGMIGLSAAGEILYAIRTGKRIMATRTPLFVKDSVHPYVRDLFGDQTRGLPFETPSWVT